MAPTAMKDAVKSGEVPNEEAKAAKKEKRWWQLWKSGD